jgi:hypothetical protein
MSRLGTEPDRPQAAFKVGDRVRVKRNARELTEKNTGWVPSMDTMVGGEFMVEFVSPTSVHVGGFNFSPEALELVAQEKEHPDMAIVAAEDVFPKPVKAPQAPPEECPGCGAFWDEAIGEKELGCRHTGICPYWAAYKSARRRLFPTKKYRTCKEYADAHWREYVALAPWIPKVGDLVRIREDAKQIALADAGANAVGCGWHHEMDKLQGKEVMVAGIKKSGSPKRDVIYLTVGWAWWIDLLEPVVSKSTGAAAGADRQGQSRASGRQTSAPLVEAQQPEREPQPVQENNLPAPANVRDPWGSSSWNYGELPPEERPKAKYEAALRSEPVREKCACCGGRGLTSPYGRANKCPECWRYLEHGYGNPGTGLHEQRREA